MQAMADHTIPTGWTLVSLRPQGQNAALRRASGPLGGHLLALPPWRLRRQSSSVVLSKLNAALMADCVVFTSPAAVHAAAALRPLPATAAVPWLAVGEGTQRALQAHGVQGVQAPARMDSEGLLALPVLAQPGGQRIGLVTAPGGRGLIAAQLAAAGAQVVRADVYQRAPLRLPARALSRLARLPRPWVLAVSSGEALARTWAQLPPAWQQQLQAHARVVVASDRLAAQAQALGLQRIDVAGGPTALQLVQAAHAALTAPAVT
ncbi:uroporphyrinogen-III synthase [Stenotrophomonas sp. 24(2023)]|uniref:uroporphyrinogen-III synthase n=1 Tax=Stenotrophomonas sp. 24(2023) TaxID=3068324 RepID=UPI0027E0661E|nr:uroporphyrinogen-III synthase [Stenotrophomonas sp. 24(2023)]WMJ71210.1 uroporphyrinogen-III synthase [Stenotrophomonas sp. 24(2023)]